MKFSYRRGLEGGREADGPMEREGSKENRSKKWI
jgi:hypothetical protein